MYIDMFYCKFGFDLNMDGNGWYRVGVFKFNFSGYF